MSDPQPHHLKQEPKRAEPWQPDRPGAGDARSDGAKSLSPDTPVSPSQAKAMHPPATTVNQTGSAASSPADSVSPEAAIARDPQTGQALNDPSLTSDDPSGLSDGASNSTRLPASDATT